MTEDLQRPSEPLRTPTDQTAGAAPVAPLPPNPLPLGPSDVRPAPAHTIESRWVPLIPGAQAIPNGVSTRSGAFLMAATRDEPGGRPGPKAPEPDLDVRSALISCLEALAPYLEPGWSHCQEHPGCLAVQEGSQALWGRAPPPSPASAPAPVPLGRPGKEVPPPDPANLPLPGTEDGSQSPNPPLMNRPASSGAGP
jgi:hypothetical protein